MMSKIFQLYKLRTINENLKKAIIFGIITSIITVISYLSIVVFSTPNLPPSAAISAALQVNYFIIIGLAIATGIQTFVIIYRKKIMNHCGIKKKGLTSSGTGNGLGAALSSFFSFFSLVPLGCCGSWLFVLSYLPLVFGSGASVFMIKYSSMLSYVGLLIIAVITIISVLRLYKELKSIKYKNILTENFTAGDGKIELKKEDIE